MRHLCVLGLAAVIGLTCAGQNLALARGGHGGHGGGHRSHSHGGHGHHPHAHAHGGHAHHAAHPGHHVVHHHGVAHRHVGPHNAHHVAHHGAWAHHYAHNRHGWNYHNHYGWGHHGWGYRTGWGWGGWNWYGGGTNYVGPSYVNRYAGSNVVVQNSTPAPILYSALGTIGTIRGNAVSIIPEEGSPITINATPNTTIVLNSQQSTLANLVPGDRVKVRYTPNLNAMTLVALR